jgi:hypothetical protein
MDVGTDNFRFNLDQKNGLVAPTQTYRAPRTTELHIDSLDRYLPSMIQTNTYVAAGFPSQTNAKLIGPLVLNSQTNTGTDCVIQTSRPLVYGYFGRVALTQMMLKFQRPTITALYNNTFVLGTSNAATGGVVALRTIVIPEGYYTYGSLPAAGGDISAVIQAQMRTYAELAAATCTAPARPGDGFSFATGNPAVFMAVVWGAGATGQAAQQLSLRTGRTLGFNRAMYGYPDANTGAQTSTQPTLWTAATGSAPNFLPTDYVDIVSSSLTNYKPAKDTNSTLAAPTAVLGRIWLTEGTSNTPTNGQVSQGTPADTTTIGVSPITVTKTWTHPNWSELSPNQTINSIDIKLLDMWGDVIPWSSANPTEWSATLTLTE